MKIRTHAAAVLLALSSSLNFSAARADDSQAGTAPEQENILAFIGARIIDGTGAQPIENGVLISRNGRISAVGTQDSVDIPDNAQRIDITDKTLIPGLINAHGHVGDVRGLETGHYNEDNLLRQLRLYARYGVTTVASLGGDGPEGFALRDRQDTPDLDRARLYVAGPVLSPPSPAQARAEVDELAALKPDAVKIRVDDFLGRGRKMEPDIYRTIINRSHDHEIPLAAHNYYLEDTKELLRAGADLIGHSVRDASVDQELIDLFLETQVCITPTLTREVSTFIYEDEPAFFSDPFFLREAEREVLATLREPARQQQMRQNPAAQQYKAALPLAMDNLKALSDAGVRIALGTDSGPPARFQGYFEHMEMEMMADAGMLPMEILYSATGGAASCLNLTETGTLEEGKWTDVVVLTQNPLENISYTKTIEQVWIAGNLIER